ncbi:MAG: hypothetical protein PVG66_15060 [Chromatiales bacterium]
MKSVDDMLIFVNKQLEHYEYQLKNPKLRNRSLTEFLIDNFQSIKEYLEQQLSSPSNKKDNKPSDYISVTPSDIEGLPPELLSELNISESDQTEFEIINIIEKHGGMMSLDHLIIALFRQTGEVFKRRNLTAKLYRMTSKGLLYKGKRGTYSTTPIDGYDEEDENLED